MYNMFEKKLKQEYPWLWWTPAAIFKWNKKVTRVCEGNISSFYRLYALGQDQSDMM